MSSGLAAAWDVGGCVPPAYSPLSAAALVRAARAAASPSKDTRAVLQAHLETRFAADAVILCGSGTQALQLALRMASKLSGGAGPIAVPAYSCFDVASAAVGAGNPVLLYDVDPGTLAPDLESVETTLRLGARVVLVATLYGVPVEWKELAEMSARYEAVLLEDAAQGHGADSIGRPLGSFGTISVLSFGRGKGWTAGRGGCVLLRGSVPPPALPKRTASWSAEIGSFAVGAMSWSLGRRSVYWIPRSIPWLGLGRTTYHPPRIPESMAAFGAALVTETSAAATDEARTRRSNADFYSGELAGTPGVRLISGPPGSIPGYLRYPILLSGPRLERIRRREAVALGIAPGYPVPLSELDPLRPRLAEGTRSFPGAKELSLRLVTLPTHGRLRSRDRQRIAEILGRGPGQVGADLPSAAGMGCPSTLNVPEAV